MAKILIIDDDPNICDTLAQMIMLDRHEVKCAETLKEGLSEACTDSYDVVFLDVWLPGGSGLDILPKIRSSASQPEVIIMTASGNSEGAELAIANGAWDYIVKPFTAKEMKLPLLRALQYRQARVDKPLRSPLKLGGLVGRGPEIALCVDQLSQASATDASVLITGETGTGKELFARAIHENSRRSESSFVVVDCAALPENLVESSLFGHEKGAFTGADRNQEGLIRQADGGTLFLDEVGELPLSTQKAFLRVLQERRFRPVGSKVEVESDFRLVAATNRSLDEMVEAGSFRKDLLFRLRSVVIALPPLRGRKRDIRDLATYYIHRFCDRYGTGPKGYSPEFMDALTAYPWPGNVRELIHAMERALTAAHVEPTLFPVHLPTDIRIRLAQASLVEEPEKASCPVETPEHRGTLSEFMQGAERRYLEEILSRVEGDIKEASRISGVSKSTLYEKMKRLGIRAAAN